MRLSARRLLPPCPPSSSAAWDCLPPTFGVAVYSNIDIVSSMCMLMARGALISVVCVILMLPAFLMLLDGVVRHTTLNMKVKE